MWRFVLRRVPPALITLVLASIGLFFLVELLPGNPAEMVLGDQATPAAVASMEHQMGLDRPFYVQYLDWVSHLLTGNLGTSYVTGTPVSSLLTQAAPATAELAVTSLVITAVVGFAVGVSGAVARRRPARAVHAALSALIFGAPEYVVGVLLILLFAITAGVLPPGGRVELFSDPALGIQYLILPAVALSLHSAAVVGRFLEAELNRALGDDYVQTALAKGVPRRRMLWRHALPNAMPAVVTVLGLRVGHLLGGAIVVEAIFAWPGLGVVLTSAVNSRDYIVIQDLIMMLVAIFIVVQVLSDVVHAWLDPRVRLVNT